MLVVVRREFSVGVLRWYLVICRYGEWRVGVWGEWKGRENEVLGGFSGYFFGILSFLGMFGLVVIGMVFVL